MEKESSVASDLNEEAEYAAKQEARMAKIVVGGIDSNGYEISKIYAFSASYKIYGVKGVPEFESLRVYIDTKVEKDNVPEKRYLEVTDDLDRLRSVLYKTGINPSYMYRAAHALQIALEGEAEKAKKLFGDISKDAQDEYQEVQSGRLAYLTGAIATSVIVTLIALVVYLYRDTCSVIFHRTLASYIYAVAFATFGGLLSISINIRKLAVEKTLGNCKYCLYGAVRQMISILGGIAIVTMIKGNFVFSLVNASGAENIFAILTISFFAGFSENFVPNSLRKIESQ